MAKYLLLLAGFVPLIALAAFGPPPGVTSSSIPAALSQQHLSAAGLARCSNVMTRMTNLALDAPSNTQSGWDKADPAHHVFQSVAGLRYPAGAQALAVMIAAPQGIVGCDGTVVQVYPVGQPCDTVRAGIAGGRDLADLQGVRAVADAKNTRVFLIPGANATCVVVTAIAYYQPA